MKTNAVCKFGEIRKSWQKGKMFKDIFMNTLKLRKTKSWRLDISEMLSPSSKYLKTSASEAKQREEFHNAFLDFFRLPQLLREPLNPFGYVIYLARLKNNDYGYVVDRLAIEHLVDDYEPLMAIFEKRGNFRKMKSGLLKTDFLEECVLRVWTPMPPGPDILRANFHQAIEVFEESSGKQCTAMCLAAIVMAHLIPPHRWNSHTMNNILIAGNDYYEQCAEAIGDYRYLAVNELSSFAVLFGSSVQLAYATDPEYFGMTVYDSLIGCLDCFFRFNQFGIFIAQDKSLAVMRFGQDHTSTVYYIFDSHCCGPTGLPAVDGAACTMVCFTLPQLTCVLLAKCMYAVGQFTLDRVSCNFVRRSRVQIITPTWFRERSYEPESGEVVRELIPETAIVLKMVLPYLFRRHQALRMHVPPNHKGKQFPSNVVLVFQCSDGSCQALTFSVTPGERCISLQEIFTCLNEVLVEFPMDSDMKLNLPY